jgi:hypothetical protein
MQNVDRTIAPRSRDGELRVGGYPPAKAAA